VIILVCLCGMLRTASDNRDEEEGAGIRVTLLHHSKSQGICISLLMVNLKLSNLYSTTIGVLGCTLHSSLFYVKSITTSKK
jgi:hypothetical protein